MDRELKVEEKNIDKFISAMSLFTGVEEYNLRKVFLLKNSNKDILVPSKEYIDMIATFRFLFGENTAKKTNNFFIFYMNEQDCEEKATIPKAPEHKRKEVVETPTDITPVACNFLEFIPKVSPNFSRSVEQVKYKDATFLSKEIFSKEIPKLRE